MLLEVLLTAAPFLGRLISGGAKASAVVDIGAKVAQEMFGTEEPSALAEALVKDPTALEAFRVRMERETEQLRIEAGVISEVNQTMRAELAAGGNWFQKGWRPLAGWVMGVGSAAFTVEFLVAVALVMISGDFKALEAVIGAITPFVTLMAIPGAVAGVSAWSRGREKIAAISGPAGLVEALAGAAKKVVKGRAK